MSSSFSVPPNSRISISGDHVQVHVEPLAPPRPGSPCPDENQPGQMGGRIVVNIQGRDNSVELEGTANVDDRELSVLMPRACRIADSAFRSFSSEFKEESQPPRPRSPFEPGWEVGYSHDRIPLSEQFFRPDTAFDLDQKQEAFDEGVGFSRQRLLSNELMDHLNDPQSPTLVEGPSDLIIAPLDMPPAATSSSSVAAQPNRRKPSSPFPPGFGPIPANKLLDTPRGARNFTFEPCLSVDPVLQGKLTRAREWATLLKTHSETVRPSGCAIDKVAIAAAQAHEAAMQRILYSNEIFAHFTFLHEVIDAKPKTLEQMEQIYEEILHNVVENLDDRAAGAVRIQLRLNQAAIIKNSIPNEDIAPMPLNVLQGQMNEYLNNLSMDEQVRIRTILGQLAQLRVLSDRIKEAVQETMHKEIRNRIWYEALCEEHATEQSSLTAPMGASDIAEERSKPVRFYHVQFSPQVRALPPLEEYVSKIIVETARELLKEITEEKRHVCFDTEKYVQQETANLLKRMGKNPSLNFEVEQEKIRAKAHNCSELFDGDRVLDEDPSERLGWSDDEEEIATFVEFQQLKKEIAAGEIEFDEEVEPRVGAFAQFMDNYPAIVAQRRAEREAAAALQAMRGSSGVQSSLLEADASQTDEEGLS